MNLSGKTVLITGATGGIGSRLANAFAAEDAKLILISRTQEKLDDLVSVLPGKDHVTLPFDFTKTSKIEEYGQKIAKNVETLDVVINAAGVGVYKTIEEVSLSEWEDSFAINVTTAFFLTKELLPLLKKSEKGVVINIGSGMGKIPTPCRSVYCATKYALRGMSLSLAAEFHGTNVHIMHIALGSTLTEFGPMSLEEKKLKNLEGKAYLTPEWVAQKFVDIIKTEEFEPELEFYPGDYSEDR